MSALFITSCGNDQVGKNQEEKNNVADKSNTSSETKKEETMITEAA